MASSRPCPACAEEVAVDVPRCPFCAELLRAPTVPVPSNDEEHLRLLSICHYVSGGLTAFFACLPLLHVAFGLFLAFSPETFSKGDVKNQPPAWLGIVVAVAGGLFVLAGWTLAVLKFIAGRCLARRRRRTFCLVVACICCILPPLGTILGVFTLIVLGRPSVKSLFDRPSQVS